MRRGWLILGVGLAGGLAGALYGAATWQDSEEWFAPTQVGLALIDGMYGFVFAAMIGVVIAITLEVWRSLAHRPGRNGH